MYYFMLNIKICIHIMKLHLRSCKLHNIIFIVGKFNFVKTFTLLQNLLVFPRGRNYLFIYFTPKIFY